MRSLLIAGAAVVAAVALFLGLRPDESDEPTAAPPTTTAQTTAPTTAAPQPPPPPEPPPAARVRITIRDGLSVGGVRRVTVARGRRVVLQVTSDVADHVHLHGYDVMRDVGPGLPAQISFRATIVGTVEVELEDRGVRIATITTKP